MKSSFKLRKLYAVTSLLTVHCFLSLLMNGQISQPPCGFVNVPQENLLGYWPFNGDANDNSGNNHNGIVNGAVSVFDRFGRQNGAYYFDGIAANIVVPNILTSLSSFTVAGWYNSDELQGGTFVYLGVNGGCCGCDGVGIGQGDGDTWFAPGNFLVNGGCNGLNWMGTEFELPPLQTWNHFALVKKPGGIHVYINGQSAHYDIQGDPLMTSSSIYFGAAAPTGDYSFKGSLDDIYYYDRALTSEEIQLLYFSDTGLSADVIYDGPITLAPNGSELLVASDNFSSYQWNHNGDALDGQNSSSLLINEAGEYSLTLATENGCQFTTPLLLVEQSLTEFECGLPAYISNEGLLGFWPFCGNAKDVSGNGNNAIVSGAQLTNDRFGVPNSAYQLNGSKDVILVRDALESFSQLTISGWYYSPNDQGGAFAYVGMNSANLGCNGFGTGQGEDVWFSPGNYLHSATGCSFGWRPTSHVLPEAGNWVHFTLVKSGTVYNVYINGVMVQQFFGAEEVIISNFIFFGGASTRGDYTFGGLLDDIAVYTRALDVNEITQLYTGVIQCDLISSETQDIPVDLGGSGQLYVTLNSTDYGMQWQTNPAGVGWVDIQDNDTYSGSQTQNLLVSNVALYNHEQPFRIIVTNGACNDTSNVSQLLLNNICLAYDTIMFENVIDVFDTITNVISIYDTINVTVTDTLIIDLLTGVGSGSVLNTLLLYPNPTSDQLTINYGNIAAMAGYSLSIFSSGGSTVHETLITQAQETLDISGWSSGVYQVVVYNAGGVPVETRQIVIQ